jgi:PAS domain S-box-containing protein
MDPADEERLLRSVALQNANSILLARQRAEDELVRAKESLERKTEELARSLAMTRATLESTTDGVLATDFDGTITDFNRRYVEMWGIPADVLAGREHRRVLEFCGRQFTDPAPFLARIDAIYRGSEPETFDVLGLADGRVFERFSRIQFAGGRDVGRVWSFRDVTQRKRAEEALRDETRVLELLNETGTAIASTLDLERLVQAITDAATQLSGARFAAFFYNTTDERGDALLLYTLSGAPREAFERFGHPRATALFGPTFRGEGIIRLNDVLADPRYGRMGPHHGMPPGHLPVRSYLAVPVVSRSGEVIGGLFFGHPDPGVFTARTERVVVGVAAQAAVAIDNARLYDDVRRAAEERKHLLEAERAARAEAERVSLMKDEFLATLSHELRTPLNAILGWAQILRADARDNPELDEGLAVIERNTRVQAQLIEDLLDMSRIISGKVRLDVQRVELQDVVKAAVASVRHSAEAKEIRLQVVLDPLAGPVRGDPNRLQQCVWNLLSNAIKFTPKGGRVQVGLERVNSHLEVCVVDDGEGIRPEFLPHVFERFRQADASTTRQHGGLGLGLSIVKHLVELHGGAIRAKSAGEGMGSTFCIELPLMVVHADADAGDGGLGGGAPRQHPRGSPGSAGSAAAIDHPSLAGLTVLAVDDEPDARKLLKRVLEDCGARVFVAASSREGLELVRRERPDMIVSDIGMPGEDGYDFIRQVRALPPDAGGRTPAAALTAFARAEDRTRALRAGYQTHVAKPVEPTELTAVVASLATRR